MRLNTAQAIPKIYTHEGAVAKRITPTQELRRSVLSCLLWESEFYESGEDIAARILRLASEVPVERVKSLAVEARSDFHLRHVPLMLLCALAKRNAPGLAHTIADTIQRPDEMTELLAIWAKVNGVGPDRVRTTITAQMKKGLALAFGRFNEYSLAKYDRDGPIKLRDVIRLVHPKPADADRAALYGRVNRRELVAPDTWEVALSGGADKKEAFTRLLSEGSLGYLALLRNLRNMTQAGVNDALIRDAIIARKGASRVLPFRYVAAARACPQMEPALDQAMCEAISEAPRLSGRTIVMVDISPSMNVAISAKSDLTRMVAAATLSSMIVGDLRVFSFSNDLVEVPPRRGMAGVDAVIRSQPSNGTLLGKALHRVNAMPHDRLIVITDEQSQDPVPDPVARHAYMINVASAKNGVGYGRWTHIDGFSESVLRFIGEAEREG